MSNIKKVIIIILIVSICGLLADNNYVIRDIHFKGNKTLSDSYLKKNIALDEKNLIQSILFWKKPPEFNKFYLENEVKQLQNIYQKEGFIDVEIKTRKKIDKNKNEIIITFLITENNYITIEAIDFQIKSSQKKIEDKINELINIEKENFKIKIGKRFRDGEVKKTKNKLYDLLIHNGFPNPNLAIEVNLDENKKKADVVYILEPNELCYFDSVMVKGNDAITSNIIKKQLSFDKGEVFSQNHIRKTQNRIQALGNFQYVTIKTLIKQIDNSKIPLEIIVKELPSLTGKIGVGYGLEDKFRTSLSLNKYHLFGGARRALLFLKHSYLEPYHFNLEFIQSAFLKARGIINLNPFLKKANEKAYDLKHYGLNLTTQQYISNSTNLFITYRFEKNELKLDSKVEDSDNSEDSIDDNYYNKSSIITGITRDISKPPFFPVKGFVISIQTTLSGLKLGSKYHYLQSLVELKNYLSIINNLTAASKLKLGAIRPIWGDDYTPIEDRFYAGGSYSIRGWSRGEVSPKNEEGVSIGGNNYFEFSEELRQLIWKRIYGVVFIDFGSVWNGNKIAEDLYYAAGVGVRVRTPIGPIRLDAARPIWHRDEQIQLHLSIGQAF